MNSLAAGLRAARWWLARKIAGARQPKAITRQTIVLAADDSDEHPAYVVVTGSVSGCPSVDWLVPRANWKPTELFETLDRWAEVRSDPAPNGHTH